MGDIGQLILGVPGLLGSGGSSDTTSPTCALTTDSADPTNTTIDVTATFSENLAAGSFVVGDISVTNGAAGSFVAVSASVYTFTVTPVADGAVTIKVNAGVCTDAAGNANEASNTLSRTYDATGPTVVITSAAGDPVYELFEAVITLSEVSTNFGIGDITPVGATLSNFAGSGTDYTVDVTPTGAPGTTITLDVGAGVFTDAAGNPNEASNTLSRISQYKDTSITITPSLGADMFDANRGDFNDGGVGSWTPFGNNTISAATNALVVTYVDSVDGAQANLNNAADLNADLAVDTFYQFVTYGNAVGAVIHRIDSNSLGVLRTLFSGAATATGTFRAAHATTNRQIAAGMGAGETLTLDNQTIKPLSTIWDTLVDHGVVAGLHSINYTCSGGYQPILVLEYEDANNYTYLFEDGFSVGPKVHLVKRVAGVETVVGSWAITYVAAKTLSVNRHVNGTLDVIYNGATLASGIAATTNTGTQGTSGATDGTQVTVHYYEMDARNAT